MSRAFYSDTSFDIPYVSLDDKIYTNFVSNTGAIFSDTLSISNTHEPDIYILLSYYDIENDKFKMVALTFSLTNNQELVFDFNEDKIYLDNTELNIEDISYGVLSSLENVTVITCAN